MLSPDDNAYLTQTGPEAPMGELFRRFFLPVLLSEELPAPDCPPVRVTILGERLLAFRASDGRVGLVEEACPHRTASLFFGRNEQQGLRCIYHGWKFDTDGRCVDMPNEPATSTFKDKVRARAFPVVERGGVIWASLGSQAGSNTDAKVPDLEWSLLPPENVYVSKVYVGCNYLQGMEGDIDSSHSAFLHSRTGEDLDIRNAVIDTKHEELRRYSFADKSPRFFTLQSENGLLIGARRDADAEHWYWRITQWMLPTYSLIPREPGHVRQCNVRVPADDNHHWFFRVQYHPERPLSDGELEEFRRGGSVFQERIPGTYLPTQTIDNDFLIDRKVQSETTFSGIQGLPTQDQAVTVSMGTIANRSREHLGTTDAAIIAARRRLMDSAEAVSAGSSIPAPEIPQSYLLRAPALLLDKDVAFDVGASQQMYEPRTQSEAVEANAADISVDAPV